MQKISGNNITMTKGDTFKAVISMTTKSGSTYTPEEDDVIRFAMKQKYSDSTPLIRKVIPNDTLLLQLDPADTKSLIAGDYVYDIELTYADGSVDTFIDRATLTLTEEVD